MINLYTWSTPNGQKASIMLEELGLPYCVTAINIGKGEQHDPEFRRMSPNGKIPVITDQDENDQSGGPLRVFESGNILIHLANKTGQFLPSGPAERAEVLGWLFFQVGHLGPMVGQWHWFDEAAPTRSELALKRYREETFRLLEVLSGRLGEAAYLGGDQYSIADIATFPWTSVAIDNLNDDEPEAVSRLEPLHAWLEKVGDRSAVKTGMKIPSEEQKAQSAEENPIAGPAGGGTVLP